MKWLQSLRYRAHHGATYPLISFAPPVIEIAIHPVLRGLPVPDSYFILTSVGDAFIPNEYTLHIYAPEGPPA